MRNTRSPSFQNQYSHSPSNTPSKKYYTREEVSAILKSTLENRLTKIYKELQQKQHIIRQLNEKLNKNDQTLQHYVAKSNELHRFFDSNSQQITVQTINKLLNDKLQNFWNSAQSSLEKIRISSSQSSKSFQQFQQEKIDKKLNMIREECEENVGNFKKKNNAYWNKVKETLGKVHNRVCAIQQKIINLGKQLSKYEHERGLNQKMLSELEKGMNSAKILTQLKKSVNNVYKNFEEVLRLQEVVKQQYLSKNFSQETGICLMCSQKNNPFSNPEICSSLQSTSRNKGNGQEFVVLEYSLEEQESKRRYQKHDPYQFGVTQPMRKQSYSLKKNDASKTNLSRPVSSYKKLSHQAMQDQFLQSHDNYYAKNQNFAVYSPITTKNSQMNESRENPQKRKLQKSYQEGLSGDSFQFNYTMNNNSTAINQSSQAVTSFMNFSLETRKENIESIRMRLNELIEIKCYERPLKVYADHINYLKNEEGNYLFDLKGNMFKVSPQDFSSLQSENLLRNIIKMGGTRT